MKRKVQGKSELKPGRPVAINQAKDDAATRSAAIAEAAREQIRATLEPLRSKRCKLTVDGRELDLEFGFRQLAAAEQFFQSRGNRDANILFSLSPATLNVSRLQALIACAAHTHQPELSFEEAKALVTEDTLYTCLNIAYDMLLPNGAVAAKDVATA